jgi:3-dehydro-4-phosphotetronate decarboxylase
MNDGALREEICRVGASLHARGYVHASAGNLSVRLPGDAGFLITPTDASLGALDPQRLAHVDSTGAQRSGDPASKTMALHRRIYAAESQASCVLHTHSTHLVALTLAAATLGLRPGADVLPPITPYFVMKVGHVPLVAYQSPGSPALADAVVAEIERARSRGVPIRAVLHERLGPNVWHRSPAEAMATLEELEETARLWLMSDPKPAPLAPEQLDELRRAFGAVW